MRLLTILGLGAVTGSVACWLADSVVVRYPWLASMPFVVMIGICIGGVLLFQRR